MKKLFTVLALFLAGHAHAMLELNENNTVLIRGPIDGRSVLDAERDLVKLDAIRGGKNYPIYVVLDSPGGDIEAGEEFIQFTKPYANLKTLTVFAASMAAGIVESIPGDRYILPNGTLMFHRAKGGFSGQFEMGEVESRLQYAKSIVLDMENVNAARLKLSLADYKKTVKDEWWLYGQQSVDNHAADAMVNAKCSKALTQRTITRNIQVLMFDIKVSTSACPLMRTVAMVDEESDKMYLRFQDVVDKMFGSVTLSRVKQR